MDSDTRSASVLLLEPIRRSAHRSVALILAFAGTTACGGQPDTMPDEDHAPDTGSGTWDSETSMGSSAEDSSDTSSNDGSEGSGASESPSSDQEGKWDSDDEASESQADDTELTGDEEPSEEGSMDAADEASASEADEACSAESLSTVSPANAGFTDTLYLRSDEDVWKFGALGCTSLPGTLFVSGEQVTSLTGLEGLQRIEGSLVFEALGGLVDLSGLDGLERIAGDLAIRSSGDLQSLAGLEQLEFLGGTLELESTDIRSLSALEDLQFGMGDLILNSNGLDSLQGLESLTYRENVVLTGSRNLDTLSGLNNLAHVSGDLTITVNRTLTSLVGLNALRTVGGTLAVEWNDALETLDGLGALTDVQDGSIASNQLLTSVAALSGVTSVHDLSIADNASLSEAVLPAVRTIDGGLSIEMNGSSATDSLVVSCPVLETAGTPNDYETGITVAFNENLSVIDMPLLNWASAIDVHENSGAFSAEMPALESAEMVAFWKNPELWTIHSLPALTDLGTAITIHTNDNLPTCELDEILFRLGECPDCQANPCNPH